MTTPWVFTTDARSDALCRAIVEEMGRLGVSAEEATSRINRAWRGLSIVGDNVVYHEPAEYWANELYWREGSRWWLAVEDRERLGLEPLSPRPYP